MLGVRGRLRLAALAGLAFMVWGETAHPGILGTRGTPLATAVAFTAASAGWLAWILLGPLGDSATVTVSVCWTAVAGSALLFVHPAPAVCWFTLWACVFAGAARPTRIGFPLTMVCVGILLAGYLTHRGGSLATLAAVMFVAYVIGRERRGHAQAATLAERGRIAAELHDILGHSLTALTLQVETATVALETVGDRNLALTHLERAGRLAHAGQEETIAAVRTLRDGALAVESLARGLIDASGVPATLTVEGTPRPLTASKGMAVYRMLQESLTNAGKHAPGADASVVLAYLPRRLTVTMDSPVGADAKAVSGGQGLRLMRERIEGVGGTLTAGPHADLWRVHAEIPS
ncbi:histidine kinase [Spirillospora sp. NPDC052269]